MKQMKIHTKEERRGRRRSVASRWKSDAKQRGCRERRSRRGVRERATPFKLPRRPRLRQRLPIPGSLSFSEESRGQAMAISPYLLPAVLLFYVLAVIPQSSGTGGDGHRHLIDRIREAELKVVQLESILMESNSIVDSKNLYVKESEKLVEEMTSEVNHLQSVLLTMKNDSSCENERLTQLEEEVRLLWDTSRRNNFELHILESKAQDAEKRLQVTKSKVETMAAIVTQHWIHIQHLEQALEIAKRGVEEVERQVTRCTFLKFVKIQVRDVVDDWWKMFGRSWSAVQQNHHQVQEFVKNELQKWNYTANKEVVFFLASALITFPALSLGVFFLNNFCY